MMLAGMNRLFGALITSPGGADDDMILFFTFSSWLSYLLSLYALNRDCLMIIAAYLVFFRIYI
jgi:hypothetical protein